jgi:predicted nucleic acid-binding protein
LNLLKYTSSDPIFIDSNIFLDYIVPHPAYYKIASNFLRGVENEEIHATITPAVLAEVSHILLLETGAVILKNHNRNIVINKIESDSNFSHLCRDAVDKFNEFINKLDGLQLIPVMPEDYFRASDLARAYNLMSFDALHLSAMRRSHVRNIASRDRDFERVDGIVVWSP